MLTWRVKRSVAAGMNFHLGEKNCGNASRKREEGQKAQEKKEWKK